LITNGYSIWNDGVDVTGLTVNEGAGGGGAGGVVALNVLTVNGILNVSVTGGDGGSTNNVLATADCTGPGGGGGGGTVWVSGSVLDPNIVVNAAPGLAGLSLGAGTSCINTTYGADTGFNGNVIFNYPPHILPVPAVVANLGPDLVACPLQPTILDPGIGFSSYLWQDGSIDTSFIAIGSDTFFVNVADSQGCFSADTILITPALPFVFTIGTGDTTVCPGQTVTIDPGSFVTYLWQDSTMNPVFITADTGLFSVTVADTFGCIGSSVYQIFNIPPFVYTIGTGDTIICPDQPVIIDAGPGFVTYIWQDSSSSEFFFTTDTGTFSVTVIDTLGCSGSASFHVGDFPNSFVFLGNDTALCKGDTIILDAGIFPQYLWYDSSMNKSVTVTDTGIYYVTIVDFNGCTISDTIVIDSFYAVPPANLINDTLVCTGTVTTIKAPDGFITYEWNNGNPFNFLEVTEPGIYSLTVTNEFTCIRTDTFIVTLQCSTALFIPDAFTPNGDGVNDIYFPIGYNITSFLMQIYNRWGTKVYETNSIDKGWQGDCKGIPCDIGTYVYYIIWTGSLEGVSDGGIEKGNVTLIR
ncbi:MAG: gliding motility-associated C-terminal domain-containing protein, partial [Chitinophagales bacterium]